MLNVALPKGRLGEKAYAAFEAAGYSCPSIKENNRKLIFENKEFTFTITFDENISEDIRNTATEMNTINGYGCYIFDIPDLHQVQIYFAYNNNLYKLTYNNKQGLIETIENLKELQ